MVLSDVKRKKRGYCESLYASKPENLDELEKFPPKKFDTRKIYQIRIVLYIRLMYYENPHTSKSKWLHL